MSGSGKGEVSNILKSKGYKVYELGDVIREEMKKRKIEKTPEAEKQFSIDIRKMYGADVTSRFLLKKAKLKKGSKAVISGFRNMEDLNYVKKHFKIVTIAVVAPTKIRFARTLARNRPQDPKTLREFVELRDRKEAKFGLLKVIANADYVVANVGTIAELRKSVLIVARDAGLL
jgi:dephospho-CoA kinase